VDAGISPLTCAGGTYFFTVVTDRRRPIFAADRAVRLLWKSIREERKLRPFSVDAVVVLPDHCQLIMTLPDGGWCGRMRCWLREYQARGLPNLKTR